MNVRRAILARIAVLPVAALALAACGGGDDAQEAATTEPAAEQTETAAVSEAAPEAGAITVADSEFGPILTDDAGLTLYRFTNDTEGVSVCEGDCATAWPPLPGGAIAADGADAALIGTIDRADGTTQTTYNGWPLYYFANDAAPGDTNGQGVNDVWFVVGADGATITGGPSVAVTESAFGPILTDGDGLTLYRFENDAEGVSACNGDCATAWPPLPGGAIAGDGADAALVGTIDRADGTTQTTYNGWPLYYFANDAAPGDTNGQGVNDVWFVVGADGAIVAEAGPTIVVSESEYGPILTNDEGLTLYRFDNDSDGVSNCYDECAVNFPPLPAGAVAGDGVDASLVGTVERTDGSTQTTYNGWPLYYHAGDGGPGDIDAQGLNDVWWVVGSDGSRVTEAEEDLPGSDY